MGQHAPAATPALHCLFCPRAYPASAAQNMNTHLLSAASDSHHHAGIIAAHFTPATPSMLAMQACPRPAGTYTRAQITALVLHSFGGAVVVVAQETARWRARKQIPGSWWEGRVLEAVGLVAASLDRPSLGVEVICVGGFVGETLRLARHMWVGSGGGGGGGGKTRKGRKPSMRSLKVLPEREYGLDRYEDDEEPKYTPPEADHPTAGQKTETKTKPPAPSANKKRKISAAKAEKGGPVGPRPPVAGRAGGAGGQHGKGAIGGFCNGGGLKKRGK